MGVKILFILCLVLTYRTMVPKILEKVGENGVITLSLGISIPGDMEWYINDIYLPVDKWSA